MIKQIIPEDLVYIEIEVVQGNVKFRSFHIEHSNGQIIERCLKWGYSCFLLLD